MEHTSTLSPPYTLPFLQTDILLSVLDFTRKQTIVILCRISKELHHICTPQLYKSVDLSREGPFYRTQDDQPDFSLLMTTQRDFLQCILDHPHVALRVQNLKWHLDIWDAYRDSPPSDGFYPTIAGLHHLLERLPNLVSVRVDSAISRRGSLDKSPPVVLEKRLSTFNASTITLSGRLSDTFLLPIFHSFTSPLLTCIELDDIRWECKILLPSLVAELQVRETPLRTLKLKQTELPPRQGRQNKKKPSYRIWASLIDKLRPETLVVSHHSIAWSRIAAGRGPIGIAGVRPDTAQERVALDVSDEQLQKHVIPKVMALHDREKLPNRIELFNVAPNIYNVLQQAGIEVVARCDPEITDYNLYLKDWAYPQRVENTKASGLVIRDTIPG